LSEADAFLLEELPLVTGREAAEGIRRAGAQSVHDALPRDVIGAAVHRPSDGLGRQAPAQEIGDLTVGHDASARDPFHDRVNEIPRGRAVFRQLARYFFHQPRFWCRRWRRRSGGPLRLIPWLEDAG